MAVASGIFMVFAASWISRGEINGHKRIGTNV